MKKRPELVHFDQMIVQARDKMSKDHVKCFEALTECLEHITELRIKAAALVAHDAFYAKREGTNGCIELFELSQCLSKSRKRFGVLDPKI
jgi:hypothetical protein